MIEALAALHSDMVYTIIFFPRNCDRCVTLYQATFVTGLACDISYM